MPTRRILAAAVFVTAAFVTIQVPSAAQFGSFYPKPDENYCPRLVGEPAEDWARRCYETDQEQRRKAMIGQVMETDRQRVLLEKQPPLPASNNRLLGRWKSATPPPSGGNPFAQLTAMMSGCGVLLGDGIVEFEPARWAVHDGDGRNDMGPASYRGGEKGAVFVLPGKGSIFNLLPFEFETPDKIHLTGVQCTLVRETAGSSGRRGAPAK
jgi:hypothetical protein